MKTNTIILEGGLGNRMRVAAAAFAMAQRTGIPMQVIWTSQWGMRCRFDELFQENEVFIRDAQGFEKILFARPTWKNLHLPRLLQRLSFQHIILAPQIWDLNKEGFDYEAWFKQGNTLMTAYRDFCPWTSDNLHLLFQPNERVCEIVNARTSKFSAHSIGVHIRRADHQQAIDQSPLELFITAIDREIEQYDDLCIYLATDDEATKTALFSRYGGRVLTSPAVATRDSTKGIREALVDMLTLSHTQHIYGSAGSTFSPIAACLGDVPITILQRDGKGSIDLLCQTKS